MTTSLASSSESITHSEANLIRKTNEEFLSDDELSKVAKTIKRRNNFILILVSIALLLDGMLNMVILPIIPEFIKYLTEQAEQAAPDSFISFFHMNKTNNSSNSETLLFNPNDTKAKFNYNKNDVAIGFLFATKPFIQLLVNPFSGTLIDHVGYDFPMLLGLVILFCSTFIFAYTTSFINLFLARGLQGVGSAIATTSGFAMIANCYKEHTERSKALGVVITSLAVGSFMSVPYSGFLFEYAGKRVPFISLACLALLDAFFFFLNWQSKCALNKKYKNQLKLSESSNENQKKTPIWILLADPYIFLCSLSLIMANVPLAFTQPTIAAWMKTTMNATESQIGMIWLAGFLPHIGGVYLTVWLVKKYSKHQHIFLMFGLFIEALSCLWIPYIRDYFVLFIPIMIICFGYGLIDATVLPTVAHLVDTRHASVYGSVYAIVDISYALVYAFGPMIAGFILHYFGFPSMGIIICALILTFVPSLYFLRKIYILKDLNEKKLTEENNQDNRLDKQKQ